MKSPSAESPAGQMLSRSSIFSACIVYVLFFAVLNESVFNVSIPQIAEQFQLLPSQGSWIVTAFIVTFGIGQTVFAKLSDRFEIGPLLVIGILIYVISGVWGVILQKGYAWVLIVRAIQGFGASSLKALTLVAVARYFSTERRAKLFGLFISIEAMAVAAGPIVGGYITSTLHWSLLFLIPLFLLPALTLFLKLPRTSQVKNKAKVDLFGASLLSIFIAFLMLACTEAQWYYLLPCLLSLSVFIIHVNRAKNPFVEPILFRNLPYLIGISISFIVFGIMMGIVFIVPVMLAGLHQLPTDRIGIVLFPGAVFSVIFGVIAGQTTARKGHRFVFYIGYLLIGAALLLFAGMTDRSIWYISGSLAFIYIGMSFVQTALTETVTRTLPASQIGAGMGFYGLAVGVSGAVGTAAVSSLLNVKALAAPLLPFIKQANAHIYSNLFLLLFVLSLVAGILYLGIFGLRPIIRND